MNKKHFPILLFCAFVLFTSAASAGSPRDAFEAKDLFKVQDHRTVSEVPRPIQAPPLALNHTAPGIRGDANNDGKVEITDLRIAKSHFTSFPSVALLSASSKAPRSAPPIGLPGNPGDWVLRFGDEFSGATLDRSKWATTYGYNTGRGFRTNNYDELEWYVDDAQIVANGTMKLTAIRGCLDSNRTDVKDVAQSDPLHPYSCSAFPFSSGMISSHKSFAQKYGYFEARVKIPSGTGTWPAFWLLPQPSSLSTFPWPDSLVFWPPEVDIFENFGDNTHSLSLNNHYSGTYPVPGSSSNNWSYGGAIYGGFYDAAIDYSSNFHTVGLDWEPSSLTWYVDGIQRFTTTQYLPPGSLNPGTMYVILNLAINATPTLNQAVYEIDYVRVYQKKSNLPMEFFLPLVIR